MEHLTAHLPDGDLSAYLLGQLPDAEQQAVEDHLDECRECEGRAAEAAPRDALVDLLHRAAARAVPAAPFSVFGNTVSSRFDSTPGDHPSTVISHEFTANAMSSPPAVLTGHSRYRVLRLLGYGGMGSVWLAEHLVMGRPVALKIIRPELLAKDGTLERFRREVQAAAKLNHPNIAHAYDAEQIGDSHFLVMEYVAGHTLSERVKSGPLPIAAACQAIRDAARGLAHAHAAGLVHRDVKPGNLIQTEDGTVKVLDFGLAISSEADSSITGENLVMGTPDYVAPEQAEDPHAADARSDIYSLGCTLYHLLSGRVPFTDDSMVKKIDAHRYRDPKPIADVSQELRLIVARMMAKQPAQRFQTALEVADALEPFCTGSLIAPCNPKRQRGRAFNRSWNWKRFGPLSLADASGYMAAAKYLLPAFALLLGVVVYRIQTDKGEIVITADEDAEISVKQGGKEITVYDTKTKQKLILNSGAYELELKGNPTGLKLDIEKATLKRGDRKCARIEHVLAKPVVPVPGATAHIVVTDSMLFAGHTLRVRHVAWSPDSKTLYSAGDDYTVRAWNRATGEQTGQFDHGKNKRVFSVCVIDDGKTLVTTVGSRLRIWDVATMQELPGCPEVEPKNELNFVAASPNGKLIATAGVSGTVRVWDVAERKIIREWKAASGRPTYYVAWAPDGDHLLAGGDPILTFRNVTTDQVVLESKNTIGWFQVAVALDGKSLGGILWNTQVLVFDRETHDMTSDFSAGQLEGMRAARMVFAPDGRLVTSGRGHFVDLWNPQSQTHLATFRGHSGQVIGIAVSPDGKWIASSGEDHEVRVWRMPPSQK